MFFAGMGRGVDGVKGCGLYMYECTMFWEESYGFVVEGYIRVDRCVEATKNHFLTSTSDENFNYGGTHSQAWT